MAEKKIGTLIREARTAAELTQAKLSEKTGIDANDISKAERGELELSQAQLKKIAKATGVTQASLLNAAKAGEKKTAVKKTAAKTTVKKTAAKTAEKKITAKKTTASASASASMKVTAAEKKLVEAYRDADADAKKAALYLLKGESAGLLDDIIRNHSTGSDGSSFFENLQNALSGNKEK